MPEFVTAQGNDYNVMCWPPPGITIDTREPVNHCTIRRQDCTGHRGWYLFTHHICPYHNIVVTWDA